MLMLVLYIRDQMLIQGDNEMMSIDCENGYTVVSTKQSTHAPRRIMQQLEWSGVDLLNIEKAVDHRGSTAHYFTMQTLHVY